MTYVLIQAGEGETQSIYFGSTKEKLIEDLKSDLTPKSSDSPEDRNWIKAEQLGLMQMLETHENWNPGRYILCPCLPIWEEWTLLIVV